MATAESFGYPGWSWFVIGSVETLAVLALLIRPAATTATIALSTIMVGAVATHVWNGVPVRVPLSLLLFLTGLFVVWTLQRLGRSEPT